MCGHGIIAVVTIALERGLIRPGGDRRVARAGCARRARFARARVDRRGARPDARVARVVRQRAVVRARVRRAGEARHAHGARGRGVRRRLLRDRGCGSRGLADRAGAADGSSRRRAWRSSTRSKSQITVVHPTEPGLHRHLRHDFHRARRPWPAPTCATSRSSPRPRSIGRPAARARARCSPCSTRWASCEDGAAVRAREHHRHDVRGARRRAARRSATFRRSCPSCPASAWITGEHTFIVQDEDDPRDSAQRDSGLYTVSLRSCGLEPRLSAAGLKSRTSYDLSSQLRQRPNRLRTSAARHRRCPRSAPGVDDEPVADDHGDFGVLGLAVPRFETGMAADGDVFL